MEDDFDLALLYLVENGKIFVKCNHCGFPMSLEEVLDLFCETCDTCVVKDKLVIVSTENLPKA